MKSFISRYRLAIGFNAGWLAFCAWAIFGHHHGFIGALYIPASLVSLVLTVSGGRKP